MDSASRPRTFRVIGRRTPKVDALDKVTGRAQFGADIALPRMLMVTASELTSDLGRGDALWRRVLRLAMISPSTIW